MRPSRSIASRYSRSAASLSLSRARARAWTPSAQSVPLALVGLFLLSSRVPAQIDKERQEVVKALKSIDTFIKSGPKSPQWVDQAEKVAKEREIALAQAAEQGKGKPANIVEKIAEGKLKTWFAENVLAEQPFVKDDTKTVGDLLKAKGLKLVRFVRYRVGEVA